MKAGTKKAVWLISVIYGLCLLYILFFRRLGTTDPFTYAEYLSAMHNFIPLKSVYVLFTTPVISARLVVRFLVNFIGNIALFIPWGMLLPICFKKLRSFKNFAALTLAVLVFVEAIQIFSRLGSFDVEDILLNLTGACIGFACSKLLLKIKK